MKRTTQGVCRNRARRVYRNTFFFFLFSPVSTNPIPSLQRERERERERPLPFSRQGSCTCNTQPIYVFAFALHYCQFISALFPQVILNVSIYTHITIEAAYFISSSNFYSVLVRGTILKKGLMDRQASCSGHGTFKFGHVMQGLEKKTWILYFIGSKISIQFARYNVYNRYIVF